MQENPNWGSDPERSKSQPTETGHNYHIGYVKTLEALLYLQVFVVPIFVAIPIFKLFDDEGIGLIVSLFAYGIIAFVLWVVLSYCVYLFENIAHIAENINYIAAKEEESEYK